MSAEQCRILVAAAEQMSNELQDARLMAESAREDANAATSTAEKTRREQKVFVERLRRLETEAFGQPQQAQSGGHSEDSG